MRRSLSVLAACALAVLATGVLTAQSTLDQLNNELVALAQKVSASVVEIEFTGAAPEGGRQVIQQGNGAGGGMRLEIQVAPMPGMMMPLRGSGIVMTSDGFILTSADHLRGGADVKAKVTLADGRTLDAAVVGRDARSGLAVLKVDAQNLTAIEIAEDTPPLGSLVVAMGDTAGVGKSLSLGIVSAANRSVAGLGGLGNATQFPNLLQITNPVTPSDVGGLVADLKGRLVGVLHSSMTGRPMVAQMMGNAGGAMVVGGDPGEGNNVRVFGLGFGGAPQVSNVSFATPVGTVRTVFPVLRKGEKVAWGYLGVYYFAAQKDKGVAVARVVPDSPAAAAGIRDKDVLTSLTVPGKAAVKFTGDPRDVATLAQRVGDAGAGTEITLGIVRDGKPEDVKVKLGTAPEMAQQNEVVFEPNVREFEPRLDLLMRQPWLGMGLEAGKTGPRVVDVAPMSPAERHGIRKDDVIMRVGDVEVKTPEDVTKEIEKHKPGERVSLAIRRGNEDIVADVEIGLQPGRQGVAAEGIRRMLARQTWLGVEAKDTADGLVVTRVFEGSPAEKGGIKLNDVVVRVDDKDIAGLADLRDVVRGHAPDDAISIAVKRDGKELDLTVKLGNMGDRAGNPRQ